MNEVLIKSETLKSKKNLDKAEVLSSISSNFLRKNLTSSANSINSDEVRQYYIKKNRDKIHSLFVAYLRKKVQPKFDLFMQNRGGLTHIDDIPLLSSSLYIQ